MRRRNRFTCRRVTELITDYLEGALDATDRARFEAHLANCDGCTAYLEQMRATIATVGQIDVGSLPDELRDDLVELYRQYRSS
ncbi:MAG: zf-HC2 domain-containing protein [Actinobacteria bacterium]|nr:zf-HC2 domain-containing protein [Actinomycetota bacterium]